MFNDREKGFLFDEDLESEFDLDEETGELVDKISIDGEADEDLLGDEEEDFLDDEDIDEEEDFNFYDEEDEESLEENYKPRKDFEFYGEKAEEEEVKDIKGITDEISEYVFSTMNFPCICLKDNLKLPKHKWLAISKLVKAGTINRNISVYMVRDGELYKAGELSGVQVMAFIDLVGMDNIFGYHNKDTKLVNDKLYVLSSMF